MNDTQSHKHGDDNADTFISKKIDEWGRQPRLHTYSDDVAWLWAALKEAIYYGESQRNEMLHEAWMEEGAEREREEIAKRTVMLRQWLNEDRITDSKKMVTNEELKTWLIESRSTPLVQRPDTPKRRKPMDCFTSSDELPDEQK